MCQEDTPLVRAITRRKAVIRSAEPSNLIGGSIRLPPDVHNMNDRPIAKLETHDAIQGVIVARALMSQMHVQGGICLSIDRMSRWIQLQHKHGRRSFHLLDATLLAI
jgi:hypothetical protein